MSRILNSEAWAHGLPIALVVALIAAVWIGYP